MVHKNLQMVDSVKTAIDLLINQEKIQTPIKIKVTKGCNTGDGLVAQTYAISIKGKNDKKLNLFVKYLPEDTNYKYMKIFLDGFQSEYKFYEEIYPAFIKFQEKKNIKKPLDNIPEYYHSDIKNGEAPLIIMENLKTLNYTLRNTKNSIDDDHLKLTITAFAKYHAISYAMKDQEPETFQKLSSNTGDLIIRNFVELGGVDMVTNTVNQFLSNLDDVFDKNILERCKNLSEVLINCFVEFRDNSDEYSVICQGDCRSNNIMYLYDDKNVPIDVKILDWQCIRLNSPLLDLCHLFYPVARKEALDMADYYFNFYYETLSRRIKELGSDPNKVFSHKIFMDHWKRCARFGLALAFCNVKIELSEKEELPDYFDTTVTITETLSRAIKCQDEYMKIMKDTVQHFIDHDFI